MSLFAWGVMVCLVTMIATALGVCLAVRVSRKKDDDMKLVRRTFRASVCHALGVPEDTDDAEMTLMITMGRVALLRIEQELGHREAIAEWLRPAPPVATDSHECVPPPRDPRVYGDTTLHPSARSWTCECGQKFTYVRRMVGRMMYGSWMKVSTLDAGEQT